MLSVAMVRFYTLQDHFSPFAGAMCTRHDSPEPEAAVSLPDLCQNVPRLVELLSAGSAGVLLATCSQLREAVCPLVTKITVTVPDKSIGVDFSVLLNSRWSSIQSLTLNNREVSEQSIHQIISAGWPYMTSLTFDHCGFGPQTASFLAQAQWPLLQTLDLAATSLAKGKWPHLQVLCLRSCSLKAEAMPCLSHADWPELRHLCLDDNDLDLVERVPGPEYGVAWQHDSGFAAMSELVECNWHKLEKLNLDNTNIAAKGCHVLRQSHWTNFRHLTMCNVGSYDLSELSKTDWPLLSGLDISQCQGSLAESIPDLIAADWPLLAHLDISDCCVGEEGLALLAEAYWPHMKSLYIQDNHSNKTWYSASVAPDVSRVVRMLTIADWPLIENLDISGCPLNAEAAELLITCPWSHLRHLRYSCTYEDESVFSKWFQSTWSCLGYKHADKVSEQMAHFVLSSSAAIHPMRHVYTDDEWWCFRNQ